MSQPDEAEYLERILLRIGFADTDEQLEAALLKFLSPLLSNLSTDNETIQKKILELLVHVNKRVKSRPKIQLPVEALLQQFAQPEASSFITNFCIIYIKLGFPRLSVSERVQLFPLMLRCLENKPPNQQNTFLHLLLPLFKHVSSELHAHPLTHVKDNIVVIDLLLSFLKDVLLLPYGVYIPTSSSSSGSVPQTQAVTVPPGFSQASLKQVAGDSPVSAEELEQFKQGIVTFLDNDVLAQSDVVIHFIIAFADSRHSVAVMGDNCLKKISSDVDWEDGRLVTRLYELFVGSLKSSKQKNIKSNERRSAVSVRVRMKLFPYLLKSRHAATLVPEFMQVIFQSLFGEGTNQKLKSYAVQFIHHICLNCPSGSLTAVGHLLLNAMRKLIKENPEDAKLKVSAYGALGRIGNVLPSLVHEDIALLQHLFDSLSKESSDVKLAVQETLTMLADSYKNSSSSVQNLLEALLVQNIEADESTARMMAVNYAAKVFPNDHFPSKYLILLASGDRKEDIQIEAKKALRLNLAKDDSVPTASPISVYPPFVEIMTYINEQAENRLNSNKKFVIGINSLPFNLITYIEVIKYLRACLISGANIDVDMDVLTFHPQSPLISQYVHHLVDMSGQEGSSLTSYIQFITKFLYSSENADALFCLHEVVAMYPDKLCSALKDRLSWIYKFVDSTKEERRLIASQLYSLVSCHICNQSELSVTIESLLNQLSLNLTVEKQHGTLVTIGYLTGAMMKTESISTQLQEAVLSKIVEYLNEKTAILNLGACHSLGEIGRIGKLPIPDGFKDDGTDVITKYSVVSRLLSMMKSSSTDYKVKEKVATCAGYLCVGEIDFPHRRELIQGIMDATETKQIELHFAIGESLVCAAEGHRSTVRRNPYTQTEDDFRTCIDQDVSDDVEWYLRLLLAQYISHDKPSIRQASCIWLFTLVKICGHYSTIQSNLPSIQAALMNFLSDKEEMLQDIASKGLSLVYSLCSDDQKSVLVSQLVDTLMTGKRPTQSVTDDSKLFQEEALGKTPDGASLSTYKEICSLASDLNQPDLIYKFMNLANHQAMWNSKTGAAFGFSTIMGQAREQMSPYLPVIVPKLYRYQFDPSPKVQKAMTSIWSTLVKDNKKTVDLYKREIMADLLKNLTSPQWRVRESSCCAVADLLSGRPVDEIVEELSELWSILFRVQDDIKESVRKAANAACVTLKKVTIQLCDINGGKSGEKATSVLLPTLLDLTLHNQVAEVRAIGLSTILEVSKNASILLKPHIPELVPALLEAVSGLEPKILNYLSVQVSGSSALQETLDSARVSASRSSPMMETINRCVQYVDQDVLPQLVPRLCEVIKSGIGVSTKIGCCKFIVSLVSHCSSDLTPFSGKLLNALTEKLHDKNTTVRKSISSAIGHLVKVSKDSLVNKLFNKMKHWYLEKDDVVAQQATCACLWAISHHSSDVLRRYAFTALPLAFFAMHGEKSSETSGESRSEQDRWEEIWQDGTPGMETGLKLYLDEIINLVVPALDSPSWVTKAQSARALETIATKLGASLVDPHLSRILATLVSGLSGRTWTGKEYLLKALSTLCTSCKDGLLIIDASGETSLNIAVVTTTVLKECEKSSVQYRLHALTCLGNIIEIYSLNYFTTIWDIISPELSKVKSNKLDDGDNDDEDAVKKRNQMVKYYDCLYTVLGQMWPDDPDTQAKFQSTVFSQLNSDLRQVSWKVELTILKTIKKIIGKCRMLKNSNTQTSAEELTTVVESVINTVSYCLDNLKYTDVKLEAVSLIETLLNTSAENPLVLKNSSWPTLLQQLSSLASSGGGEIVGNSKKVLTLYTSLEQKSS